jgi:hypothetical protein
MTFHRKYCDNAIAFVQSVDDLDYLRNPRSDFPLIAVQSQLAPTDCHDLVRRFVDADRGDRVSGHTLPSKSGDILA